MTPAGDSEGNAPAAPAPAVAAAAAAPQGKMPQVELTLIGPRCSKPGAVPEDVNITAACPDATQQAAAVALSDLQDAPACGAKTVRKQAGKKAAKSASTKNTDGGPLRSKGLKRSGTSNLKAARAAKAAKAAQRAITANLAATARKSSLLTKSSAAGPADTCKNNRKKGKKADNNDENLGQNHGPKSAPVLGGKPTMRSPVQPRTMPPILLPSSGHSRPAQQPVELMASQSNASPACKRASPPGSAQNNPSRRLSSGAGPPRVVRSPLQCLLLPRTTQAENISAQIVKDNQDLSCRNFSPLMEPGDAAFCLSPDKPITPSEPTNRRDSLTSVMRFTPSARAVWDGGDNSSDDEGTIGAKAIESAARAEERQVDPAYLHKCLVLTQCSHGKASVPAR